MVMPKTVNCFPSWMVMPKTVNGITIQVEWLCRRQSTAQPSKLNGYAEDIQLCFPSWMVMPKTVKCFPSWMFMPKTVNGISIQVEWLCRGQSTVSHAKLNGYAEDSQLFSKVEWLQTFNCFPSWIGLCRRQSTAIGITIQVQDIQPHNYPSWRHWTA
jgi:hypothetical protein